MVDAPDKKIPETAPSPEQVFEVLEVSIETDVESGVDVEQETVEVIEDDEQPVVEKAGESLSAAPAVAQTSTKDPELKAIEDILAEDLTDLFLGLPDQKKPLFKQKGEEIAYKVKEMVDKGKVKVYKIIDMIRDWLKMVPGVNKFFLEQEVKIKADKLLLYAQAHSQGAPNVI